MEETIDFENIEDRLRDVLNSKEYQSLVKACNDAKKIYLIGNGGLHFVACHAATDMTRLIPDKAIYSFDSVGYITSNANDHGYDNLFSQWLENTTGVENPSECLVVGMSCSGKSKNILNALEWASEKGFSSVMISGKSHGILSDSIEEISLDCKYFHTVEVLALMIFYDMIMKTGNRCPSIDNEIRRKFVEGIND